MVVVEVVACRGGGIWALHGDEGTSTGVNGTIAAACQKVAL